MPGNEISIVQDQYEANLALLRSSNENLTPSTVDVSEISCQAEAMRLYRAKLFDTEILLEAFKRLVQKDCSALHSVQDNMVMTDYVLSGRLHP